MKIDKLIDFYLSEDKLTTKQRKSLPKSDFALPPDGYPIPDIEHARNALARVSGNGTPAEQATVRKNVYRKFPELKKNKEEREGK